MNPPKLPDFYDLQEMMEIDVEPTPAILGPLIDLLKSGDQLVSIAIEGPAPLRAWMEAVIGSAVNDDNRDGFRLEDLDEGRSRLTIRARLTATEDHLVMLDTVLQGLEAAAAT